MSDTKSPLVEFYGSLAQSVLRLRAVAAVQRAETPIAPQQNVIAPNGLQGETGASGEQGPQGVPGPQGPEGPMGPMPLHQWDGSRLRFELALGDWGEWVDVQGPPGQTRVMHGGGGGGGTTVTTANGYFPQGW